MKLNFKKWLMEIGFGTASLGIGSVGTGAIVNSCKGKKDSYNVWGACSDLKRKKKRGSNKKSNKSKN